jgi:DNA-binding response OmpR family regulator/DNA-binding CsgD family transcriptional regulator
MSNILIVDDDLQILELIVKILKAKGYKAVVANNGRKALAVVEKTEPDLILMDWNMPEMNGLETIGHLKKNPKTAQIPIIMLTSQSSSDYVVRGFEAGAIDYIKKPIDIPELLIRVESTLKLIASYNEIAKLKLAQSQKDIELERIKNEALSNEVESKNRELYLTGLHLAEKNALLAEVATELNDESHSISKVRITALMDKLTKAIDLNEDLNYFKENLTTLNFELIERLKKTFAKLTDVELKICSMLIVGLSNKEMASLLFISTRTVENHRYRISKKVSLPSQIDLKSFIQNFLKTSKQQQN